MTTEELAASVRGLLENTTLSSVGRTLDMGELHTVDAAGGEVAIHLQRPFQLGGSGHILLGSDDLNHSMTDEWAAAFDNRTTVYDKLAAELNDIFRQSARSVTSVQLGEAGALTVSWTTGLRLEVLPNSTADKEAWRVLRRHSGPHYDYPEHLI